MISRQPMTNSAGTSLRKPSLLRVLFGAACAIMLVTSAPAQSQDYIAAPDKTAVETEAGRLVGGLSGEVYRFLGVRYAEAQRFMPPSPVTPWQGDRPAVAFGNSCPIPKMTSVAGDELFNPHRYMPESEDCLHLNLWTPAINDGGKRPVMVWIHGGGFTNGSGIEQLSYDGENLAKTGDVVVLTLNHRLNALGYLDLSAYGEEFKNSGNASIEDLVAALTWVNHNIAAFGGDPENVTIFGQSGGGYKVRALMGAPAAKGLFHKAIVMSGSRVSSVTDPESSAMVAKLTLDNLGIPESEAARIKEVDYATLIEAATKALKQATDAGAKDARWAPVLNGAYFPADPVGETWSDLSKDVPLLVGNVLNEFTTVIGADLATLMADNKNQWSDETARAKLAERFGDKAAAVETEFLTAYPGKKLADAYFIDTRFRHGGIRDADLKAKQGGAPVYAYMFTKESPVMGGVAMAWHCADIPYVFANAALVNTATGGDEAAIALGQKMSSAWVNFARSGNPNAEGLPDWPAYSEGGATMIFDDESRVANHPDRKLMEVAGSL